MGAGRYLFPGLDRGQGGGYPFPGLDRGWGGMDVGTPPPHRCEHTKNITFPHPSDAGGKYTVERASRVSTGLQHGLKSLCVDLSMEQIVMC